MLTDNETKVDLLNSEAIAKTIATVLRKRPDHPVTIGVHGDWGAGKSSVLEMIEAQLSSQPKVLCLKFNGWRFQGFEDAKIALIEGIVNGLIEKRPALTKAAIAVKEVYRRIDWLKVAKKAGGLALTAFTGVPTLDQVQTAIGALERLVGNPTELLTKEKVESAVEGAKSLLKEEADTKKVPEEIRAFREAFDRLLEEAGVDQLVVLIDDLDRCLPETAIETLEAVRLFVFTSRTAFVVAADEAMIEYAVREHFPDLPDTTGPRDYARNYLEKLIQVPFRIPALGETETRIYVTLLLVGAELPDNDPAYNALISTAREELKRPWRSAGLGAAAVRSALGDKAPLAHNALALSDQIGPILANGTRGNPRQIKRFLNTLLLRNATAEARGFGDEIKLPVLAKLMLAERFLPRLFDQIAAAAATHERGECEELVALEAAAIEGEPNEQAHSGAKNERGKARAGTKPKSGARSGADAEVDTPGRPKGNGSAVLSEWLSSEATRAWARVQPPLVGVDLRPYLFIAKDRKDYFGATSALGHLAAVADRLMGPRLTVSAMLTDLRNLVPAEAAQVFEALRGRIMAGGSLATEPSGVAGLSVLVQAQPALQANLLDFLEGLPIEGLGPWVVSGWDTAVRDAEFLTRLERLLESFSARGDHMLRVSASMALRTRRARQ